MFHIQICLKANEPEIINNLSRDNHRHRLEFVSDLHRTRNNFTLSIIPTSKWIHCHRIFKELIIVNNTNSIHGDIYMEFLISTVNELNMPITGF